jgi:hypothetical protein
VQATTMAAVKTLIVLCFVVIALADATQLLPRRFHGKIGEKKLNDVEKTEEIPKHLEPVFPAPSLNAAAKASYGFAVDVSTYGSVSTFQCIYKQGYGAVFVQAYSPVNGGSVNTNLIQNLNNVGSAMLRNEIYVTPATTGKTGAAQFDATYNYLKASGVNVRSIWLQVTSPINWSINIQSNNNLIQSFVSRANQNGVSVGIYTNWYDWQQITGSYTAFSTLRLWYWSSYGQGPTAESQASFDDFRGFAGWKTPAVKQFALNEGLCGLTLNRNVYPSGSKTASSSFVEGKLTVGGFV